LTGHTALIVGAGFSKPFGGPLLRELLSDENCAKSKATPESLRALSTLVGRMTVGGSVPNLESAFTSIWDEQYTNRNFEIGGEDWPAKDLLVALRLHLGSVMAGVRLDGRKPITMLLRRYLRKLVKESRTLTVVSFNYDTVIEDAFASEGLLYSYGPRNAIRFTDKSIERKLDKIVPYAEVLKLHGSVNWGVCRECDETPVGRDLINAFSHPYVPPRNISCQFCEKRFLVPSIVPPVLTKGPALQSLEPLWIRARKTLSRAREIVIVGYSLPGADSQATSLLQSVDGPLKRPRITVVCGARGAPASYQSLFRKFSEFKEPFEAFLERS
jgi:hypothetical protein